MVALRRNIIQFSSPVSRQHIQKPTKTVHVYRPGNVLDATDVERLATQSEKWRFSVLEADPNVFSTIASGTQMSATILYVVAVYSALVFYRFQGASNAKSKEYKTR